MNRIEHSHLYVTLVYLKALKQICLIRGDSSYSAEQRLKVEEAASSVHHYDGLFFLNKTRLKLEK